MVGSSSVIETRAEFGLTVVLLHCTAAHQGANAMPGCQSMLGIAQYHNVFSRQYLMQDSDVEALV
jgi:hypothetical protein